ncbi:MAG: ribosome biogenesis GTP-binding protein YihA/YsxC [Raoultibacter sp.]
MNYNQVEFKGSYGTSEQLPESKRPEVSFVGRSNVGKSSLLNKIFNRKGLVKVSSTPGKTTTINFFGTDEIDFVDLPGYGFAKVAAAEKGRWSELISSYFDQYRFYALVVVLIDLRHPAAKLDEQMIEFLTGCELPFMIALTKADKMSKSQASNRMVAIRQQLKIAPDFPLVVTSAENGTGIDKLRTMIEAACK